MQTDITNENNKNYYSECICIQNYVCSYVLTVYMIICPQIYDYMSAHIYVCKCMCMATRDCSFGLRVNENDMD